MQNNVYDEQEEQTNGGFLANFYNNNKVLIWIFIGIIVFILLINLFTKKNNSVSPSDYNVVVYHNGVECTEDIYVKVGRSINLQAKLENSDNATFTWKVGDDKIAIVDNGNVRAIGYGRTTVQAVYVDRNNQDHPSKLINIIVGSGEQDIPLTDVKLKDGDLFMPLNSTYQIALELVPTRGYVESEVFTSSNTSVVTVDNNGLVTSIGEGEATINFDINNGLFRGDLKVYVDRDNTKNEIIVTPDTLSFNGELFKIKKGSTETLKFTYSPQNTNLDKLIWKSSNENYVTVKNGKVTGVSEGRATVTVMSVNGKSDSIEVEVESGIIEVTSIDIAISDITLFQGNTQVITPIVIPSNASNKALEFNSMNNSIASVVPNSTGTQATITGLAVGNTSIIVSAVGSSNPVEKIINVKVISSGNNGIPNGGTYDGGESSSESRIVSFSPAHILKYNESDANKSPVAGNLTINAILKGVAYIKYGFSDKASSCNLSNTSSSSVVELNFKGSGLHVLCYKKFEEDGTVIPFQPGGHVVNDTKYLYVTIKN